MIVLVADGVDARLHARFAHPVQGELAGRSLFLGQKYARQRARLLAAAGEFLAVVPDVLRG